MKLTKYEEELVDGYYGSEAAKVMEIMLKIGEVYGADELIEVKQVHLATTQILALSGEGGIDFLCRLGDSGVRFRATTVTDPISIDCSNWQRLGITPEFAELQLKGVEALKKLGAIQTFTCTPYYEGFLPKVGDHLAWVETSAVIFVNSYFGARSNRECDASALASAICGRTPRYGLHLEENRVGQVLINVQTELKDVSDYGALGNYVGVLVGSKIPVFQDKINPKPRFEYLVHMGAALATSAPLPLFHFFDITPEISREPEKFGKSHVKEEIVIGKKEMEKARALLNYQDNNEIDYVAIGCPHFSPEDVKLVAGMFEGKRVNPKTEVWVCMSHATKQLMMRTGEIETIEKSGAKVVVDTCMVTSTASKMGFKNMATDSAKAAFYMAGMGVGVRYGTTDQCIKAAVNGYWS